MEKQVQKTDRETLSQKKTLTPAVDVFENADELLLVADLPGVTSDHLHVVLDRDHLTIEGTQVGSPGRDETFYKREFTVAQDLDSANVAAEMKNGVLTVHLPKSAKSKPRQIQVRAS